jgi:Ca-activated chloride channel family protein
VTFGQPLFLLTLLVVPLAILGYVLLERRRARYAVRYTNLAVLETVVGGRQWRRYVAPVLLLLALATLCVGVARPRVHTTVAEERATVILVVDASGSMQATDVKPSRLGAVQEAVRLFLRHVPSRLRVGMIVFAGEPQVAAPPTTDRGLVNDAVDALGYFPGYGGTAIGDALGAAVELGKRAIGQTGNAPGQTIAYRLAASPPTTGGHSLVSIVLLSDGSQTRGLLQPLDGAQRAKEAGFPVYTVAVGTPHGVLNRGFGPFERMIPVPPDPATLSAIARTTGGQFVNATDAKTLRDAYSRLGSELGRVPGRSEKTWAFLAGAAVLLVAAGIAGAFWSPRLP